jgi:hypothetical protein
VVTQTVIVSDYKLDDQVSIPSRSRGFFLWPLCPDRLWGSPSLLSNGYRGTFPRDKARPKRDADRSLPPSIEVKNAYQFIAPVSYFMFLKSQITEAHLTGFLS